MLLVECDGLQHRGPSPTHNATNDQLSCLFTCTSRPLDETSRRSLLAVRQPVRDLIDWRRWKACRSGKISDQTPTQTTAQPKTCVRSWPFNGRFRQNSCAVQGQWPGGYGNDVGRSVLEKSKSPINLCKRFQADFPLSWVLIVGQRQR